MDDFKSLLPPYTVSADVAPLDVDNYWQDSNPILLADAPASQYVYFNCYANAFNYEVQPFNCDAPVWAVDAVEALVDAEVSRISAVEGWSGYFSISVYFSGNVIAGSQEITLNMYSSYEATDAWVEFPVVTFEADTFAEWLSQWPDPTVGGLFPNATTANDVVDVFAWDEPNWDNVIRLNWTGNDYAPAPPPPGP